MLAVAAFSIVSGIFLAVFSTSLTLGLKNVSLNDSNAEMQTGFGQLINKLEGTSMLTVAVELEMEAREPGDPGHDLLGMFTAVIPLPESMALRMQEETRANSGAPAR